MNRIAACVLLITTPLAAQQFRITRHAGLPAITVGDKSAAGDVDADGDIDLVIANDNAPNQLLLNDGRGRFVDATAGRFTTPPINASHAIDLADIDGDRDLDILVGNDDFLSNRVYRNNGSGAFTDVTATALPPNAEFTQNQVVADFDGDGDVDWFTVDAPGCHYYRNDGAGVFTDASATSLQGLPNGLGDRWDVTPRAADADGDGDLDVLVPRGTGLFLIRNQGGILGPAPTQPPAVTGWFSRFADLDGDGDQDILANAGRVVLQNQGNGTFANVTAAAFPPAPAPAPAMGMFDVDLDGDLDLVTAAVIWVNNGAGSFAAIASTTPAGIDYRLGAAAADFDGDGDVDLPGRPGFLRQLNATVAPARGATWSLDVHARPGTASFAIVAAALAEVVQPAGSLGLLRLDPASLVTVATATVPNGALTLTWNLPSGAQFAGMELHYQALILDPVTGLRLSNGIREVVQ